MNVIMQAEEVREIRWVKFEEAKELIEFQSMQEIITMADAYISKTN